MAIQTPSTKTQHKRLSPKLALLAVLKQAGHCLLSFFGVYFHCSYHCSPPKLHQLPETPLSSAARVETAAEPRVDVSPLTHCEQGRERRAPKCPCGCSHPLFAPVHCSPGVSPGHRTAPASLLSSQHRPSSAGASHSSGAEEPAGTCRSWPAECPRTRTRAGQQRAGAFGAAGCRAALLAARSGCRGPRSGRGRGASPAVRGGWGEIPGGQCGAGGLAGPGQPPPARAARGSPAEAPAGPGAQSVAAPPGTRCPLCQGTASPLPRASAAPIEMRELLRFLPAKNKEAAAFIKAGPEEYGSDKFV
ncbi:collagen alpha-2(I) chain-like [Catharus ustulatus]|uniref:collagen alpha-2(I) chain-like n=1 Tax=Catharus ustulatus TaxID=91951 RepID=UPI00140A679C|nr:collagen alpha-2(I) chain-like [Catharus ustulatus]